MPTPVADSIFSVLPFKFAELLAQSPSNIAFMGVADAAAALAKIPTLIQVEAPETPVLDEPAIADVDRPRIIVCEPSSMEFGRGAFINSARVVCIFEMNTPSEYRKNQSSIEGPAPQELIVMIRNWAGKTTKEAQQLSENGSGYPLVLGGSCGRTDRTMTEEAGDVCRLRVAYNVGLRTGARA